MDDLEQFCRSLPKAELHMHIEGSLEPELMLKVARRNDVELPFRSAEEVRSAYEFTDLQSFLDIYYRAAAALRTETDFYDLMKEYVARAHAQGVRRAEIFFDPQTHTGRGIEIGTVMSGFRRAIEEARELYGVSCDLILCFLRHLSPEGAVDTLGRAMPYRDWFIGVGLDSTEVGNPPERFEEVFRVARSEGLRVVAHAGEEGPPSYIWGALDVLGAERIEHGVSAVEDESLIERLLADRVPLTMCPLSNVKLRVVTRLEDHPVGTLLRKGLLVSINSDDPAFFGGYVADNYAATARALDLSREELVTIARNSFESAFLSMEERLGFLTELDAVPVNAGVENRRVD